jgi:hypothetical protein
MGKYIITSCVTNPVYFSTHRMQYPFNNTKMTKIVTDDLEQDVVIFGFFFTKLIINVKSP